MVSEIIRLVTRQSSARVAEVIQHHRLGMAAENVLGKLLEEYIAAEVEPLGWFCCWNSTVRSVDFCSRLGKLLQVKNRSNSENSSSAAIRHGTRIEKWFRVNATTGRTQWPGLVAITNCESLSEDGFWKFIRGIIQQNPDLLYLEGI